MGGGGAAGGRPQGTGGIGGGCRGRVASLADGGCGGG